MMSFLNKEICRYCSKNISVGQIIIECDNCKYPLLMVNVMKYRVMK